MGKFVLHEFAPLASSSTIWPRAWAPAWHRGQTPSPASPSQPWGHPVWPVDCLILPLFGRSQKGHPKCSTLFNNAGYPSGYCNLLYSKDVTDLFQIHMRSTGFDVTLSPDARHLWKSSEEKQCTAAHANLMFQCVNVPNLPINIKIVLGLNSKEDRHIITKQN